MTGLNLSRMHFPVTTLGLGRRVGIWFQGCSIRCPGCISVDTWAPGRGATATDALLDAIEPFLGEADGLTVSGGEPFEQPEALRELLAGWRARHPGDILVFSGHPIENLGGELARLEGLIDGLMTDPYLRDAAQTMALRGSDNQRLTIFTALGDERLSSFERALGAAERTMDVMFDDSGEVFLAGIPRRNDLIRFEALLAAAGHEVKTTMDGRVPR